MSVEIESVTVGSDTEKRLVLANGQWAATLALGTDWDIIRVGARIAWDDSGGTIFGTPGFYLGLTSSPVSGLTNGPLSGINTKHFIGLITQATTWSRSASQYTVGANALGKKVGTTTTGTGSNTLAFSLAPSTTRTGFVVQIEKGSPNFTIRASFLGVAPMDHDYVDLLAAMDVSDFSTAAGLLNQSAFSGTVAVDEATDGFFNALCVAWDRATPEIHISEMLFGKYA